MSTARSDRAAFGPFSLERAVNAVERVRQRLLRAAAALERAGVEYAVAGDNAVALWVSRVDAGAVRNTRDVDVLIRRADFESVRSALESAGFVHRRAAGIDMFLDGPNASAREAIHIVFAGEMVRPGEPALNPGVEESERVQDAASTSDAAATQSAAYRVLSLQALVRVKLTAFRDKDRTHLRDMIDVGLIDESWVERLRRESSVLADRLQLLLDTPGG